MKTATTTCDIIGSSTICTTDTIQNFVGGFSYGEVLIILLLLMIFTLFFFTELKKWFFKDRINNYINK